MIISLSQLDPNGTYTYAEVQLSEIFPVPEGETPSL